MTKPELLKLIDERFGEGGYNCSQTVLTSMADYFELDCDLLKDISAPFGGGLSGIRVSVCGAISGGLMVVGLMEKGDKSEAGRELIGFVKDKYKDINCDCILDIDFNDKVQVQEEKEIKSQSICAPLLKDVCIWLADKYS